MHTILHTMPLKKIAITIPADVLKAIDQGAKARGESRSKYITRILKRTAGARRDAEITRKIDELYSDPEFVAAELAERKERW